MRLNSSRCAAPRLGKRKQRGGVFTLYYKRKIEIIINHTLHY